MGRKTRNKILTVLASFLMVFSSFVPAFAEGPVKDWKQQAEDRYHELMAEGTKTALLPLNGDGTMVAILSAYNIKDDVPKIVVEVYNAENTTVNTKPLQKMLVDKLPTEKGITMEYIFHNNIALPEDASWLFVPKEFYGFDGERPHKVSVSYIFEGKIDSSKTTDMTGLFSSPLPYEIESPTYLKLTQEKLDTKKVTNMSGMFWNMNISDKVTQKCIEYGINTENVADMSSMFSRASWSGNLDLSNYKTGKVTNMSGMFGDDEKGGTTVTGLENWDISNVTNMSGMFVGVMPDPNDLYSWNGRELKDIEDMYYPTNRYEYDFFNLSFVKGSNFANASEKAEIKKLELISDFSRYDIVASGSLITNATWLQGRKTYKITDLEAYKKDREKGKVPVSNSSIVNSDSQLYEVTGEAGSNEDTAPSETTKVDVGVIEGHVFAEYNKDTQTVKITGDENYELSKRKYFDYIESLAEADSSLVSNGNELNLNIDIADPIALPTDSTNLFVNFVGYIILNRDIHTENVTNMRGMFYNTKNANPDVSKWDTSNVTDMRDMFMYAKNANPDVSKWDTSNVTDMSFMFDETLKADPDVSKWDTSSVISMSGMFRKAKNANPDVSKWDTSNVADMAQMFAGTVKADPDVSKWDTSSVVYMALMFAGTVKADPDVSKWDTSNVVNMASMFYGAVKADPDVSKWDTSNVTDMSSMFDETAKADPDVSKWDTSSVVYMRGMFYGAVKANPDVSKWDTSNVTEMLGMFAETAKADPDVSKWDTSNVIKMDSMFSGAVKANPDVSKWDTSNVNSFADTFKDAKNANPDVSKWDITNKFVLGMLDNVGSSYDGMTFINLGGLSSSNITVKESGTVFKLQNTNQTIIASGKVFKMLFSNSHYNQLSGGTHYVYRLSSGVNVKDITDIDQLKGFDFVESENEKGFTGTEQTFIGTQPNSGQINFNESDNTYYVITTEKLNPKAFVPTPDISIKIPEKVQFKAVTDSVDAKAPANYDVTVLGKNGVYLSGIEAKGQNGYAVVDYNTDFAKLPVNSNKIGLLAEITNKGNVTYDLSKDNLANVESFIKNRNYRYRTLHKASGSTRDFIMKDNPHIEIKARISPFSKGMLGEQVAVIVPTFEVATDIVT